jgi:D-alanine-D-alanine ligase
LAGGKSAERDVSLASGAAVSQGLEDAGCEVLVFDPGVSDRAFPWSSVAVDTSIGTEPPSGESTGIIASPGSAMISPADLSRAGLKDVDLVFIALHGGDGENGHLQALLDAAGISYAGSGMLASALAMDKNISKRIFVAEGIPTPNWEVVRAGDEISFADIHDALGLPFVVKPNAQGSTVGLSVVKEENQWQSALEEAYRWDECILCEEYIAGREFTASILGGEALPVIEIIPSHGIYDYECKYTSGRTQYVCPADLPPAKTRMVQEQGLLAFQALGCQGFGRADFRMLSTGELYCLEVNTLPGMTEISLVPKAAKAAGIEFPDLVRRICELGLSTRSKGDPHPASEAAV